MQATLEIDRAFASLSVNLGGIVPETLWLLASDPDEDEPTSDESFWDEVLELRCASL